MPIIDYQNAKGWLKDGERQLLYDLAKALPGNAVILNIGVEFGGSLACLRAGNPTAQIIGVDLDCSKAVSQYDCDLIQRDSHDLVKNWIWPLDLIFVDGDHGELGVFLDAGFADFLPVGGHILFQDVFDWDEPGEIHRVCPGVYAGVERWFAQPHIKQEFEELPSVETTRIFKRVKEHVTDGGNFNTDLQPGPTLSREPDVHEPKPQVRRRNQNNNRG